jgi:microcin C transport system substrate-binding protein
MNRMLIPSLILLVAGFVGGCGGKKDDGAAKSDFPGMEADLAATIAREKDFYQIKTIADLPADLRWESNTSLPDIGSPEAKKGGTINFYLQDFPRTVRTIGPEATGSMRQWLLDYVEVPLALEHPNHPGKIVPGLAEEWAVVRPERTMYYRIDESATWSDGHPITTADVVFSLYFMRSSFHRINWYTDFHTKTWEKVTVFDDRTFALTMPELRPDFEVRNSNGLYLYPRHAMQELGPDYPDRFQWKVLPVTGPYILRDADIDKGRSVTLTRVKDWWARDHKYFRYRFNPDRYRLQIIRDHDKALESFMRGDIDYFRQMTPVPKYWYDTLPDTHPLVASGYIHKTQFFTRTPRPDWGLWMNEAMPLLNNKDVRWGIQYATNIDTVVNQYHRGAAEQMNTRSDGYSWRSHPTLEARPFDPVKAREYFAKAGFTTQGPDGVLTSEKGDRLSFSVTTYRPDIRDILTILKSEAIKAGLELRIEILDQTTGWKKVQEKQHEIAAIAFSRTPELFPRYWDFYHGSNAYVDAYLDANGKPVDKASQGKANPQPAQIRVQSNNVCNVFIPELDRLIEAYDQAETLDEVKQLAAQIEEIIYDDASWVPGWAQPYYRGAYWRYVRWPDDFNVMTSLYMDQWFVHWIDEDMQKETREALKSGQTFPPQIKVFDQYREPESRASASAAPSSVQ